MLSNPAQIDSSVSPSEVDVLIVNYKTPGLTIGAARSALKDVLVRRVIVVDNASGDGSVDRLAAGLADQADRVELIASARNLGFGGGTNLAARAAGAKYLFLLNSDAVAERGCVALLRGALARDPRLGLVAPSVILAGTGKLQPGTHGVFPTPASLLLRRTKASPDADMQPDWISGVALLARRAEYEALGGFDESLFMYYEDVDLCRRYRAQGFTIGRESAARVIHKLGQSGIGNPRHKANYYRSQERYLELAGYSPLTRLALAGARAMFNALRRLSALGANRKGRA